MKSCWSKSGRERWAWAVWSEVAIAIGMLALPFRAGGQVPAPAASSSTAGRVASLAEVRGLTSGDACKALPTPGVRSSLSRVRNGRREPAWPTENVLANDRFTVQPRTDVRVLVQPPLGTGTIYLTPDLGQCPASVNALRSRGLPTPAGAAAYRFSTERDPARPGAQERVVLTVEHGSTVVEWSKGPLIVYAGARRLEVRGTRFAVIVDAASQQAAVYVIEGVVAIVGPEGLSAAPGETVVIRPAGAVRVASPDIAFVDDVRHKSRTVWGLSDPTRGFPLKWVVGGAALVGAGLYIANRPDNGGNIPALITIRIPF